MALLFPQPGDRGEPDTKSGRSGAAAVGEDRRLLRSGAQVLARGALACPGCELPISPAPKIRPRQQLSCAYCDHTAEALEFLRRDWQDAPANDVVLVARLG